jgi:peptidoglycan-associated lipoprotein
VNSTTSACSVPAGSFRWLGLAAVLLAVPGQGAGTDGAILDFYFGPNDVDFLELQTLKVRLDGQELPVPLPGPGANPEVAIYTGPIAPGAHQVDVEAGLVGRSKLFSNLDGYRFRMGGHLDLQVPAFQVLGIQARVVASADPTLTWQERYRLLLAAASFRSQRAGAPDLAVATEAPAGGPSAPATAGSVSATGTAELAAGPAAPERPAGASTPPAQPAAASASAAAACHLDPVPFGFDRSSLSAEARPALDRFAACLAGTSATVRLDGHTDLRGGTAYNQQLGDRRATSVARYLRDRGVSADRISLRSLGRTSPVCSESTEECHARNRRVEALVRD